MVAIGFATVTRFAFFALSLSLVLWAAVADQTSLITENWFLSVALPQARTHQGFQCVWPFRGLFAISQNRFLINKYVKFNFISILTRDHPRPE